MAAVTLTELISRVRQRSDQEHSGSNFVTDAEITRLINVSYAELYGHLIRWSLSMVESLDTITADGSSSYALPADIYSVVAVFRVDGQDRTYLERYSSRHRFGSSPAGTAVGYRVANNAIEFYPRPSGGTYEVVYVPVCGQLVDGTDEMDGVLGWEEYVVIDCAIHILDKEESDSSRLRADRDRILQRIEDEASAAEMNESWYVESDRREGSATLLRNLQDITGTAGYRGAIRGLSRRY